MTDSHTCVLKRSSIIEAGLIGFSFGGIMYVNDSLHYCTRKLIEKKRRQMRAHTIKRTKVALLACNQAQFFDENRVLHRVARAL
jgi:hypothetical protein